MACDLVEKPFWNSRGRFSAAMPPALSVSMRRNPLLAVGFDQVGLDAQARARHAGAGGRLGGILDQVLQHHGEVGRRQHEAAQGREPRRNVQLEPVAMRGGHLLQAAREQLARRHGEQHGAVALVLALLGQHRLDDAHLLVDVAQAFAAALHRMQDLRGGQLHELLQVATSLGIAAIPVPQFVERQRAARRYRPPPAAAAGRRR